MNLSSLIESRMDKCTSITHVSFDLASASLYVRRFFNEKLKQNVLEMINSIMEELYKVLSSNNWMDDETRYSLTFGCHITK